MPDKKTGKKKILLVDDETDFLAIMGEHMESWGYEVITAASADEAMRAFKETRPDVAVLDYVMPDTDGISLLRKIRGVDKAIPVIMFTAKPEAHAMKEAKGLEIVAFVPKLSPYVDTQKSLKSALSMALKEK